ncbi:bifunctional diguanylate cyclase/phosphodiesterase [Pseudomonas sp. GV071]|uniref:putative bifunctional diguanylate cyclase/phosphodiesterase n=1 Tax=Pseudomonas sp. GV071 TaxID=2135754 RepID=UPI000D385040|nr:EAL domain-containing protein [Pseudomonas sp. GV071]PTQ66767.1 PAS domain S-box-containing protein/diguanylate cyclase (GGDEF)-like protein [Pseudomonas sp. GV071]
MSDELWQRRLDRERQARKSAEHLLTEKSRELYQSAVELKHALAASEDQRRLQLALWGSGELIWEWQAQDNLMHLHYFSSQPGETLCETLLWSDWLQRLHPDDQGAALRDWNEHLCGSCDYYDLEFRARSTPNEAWRWLRTQGRAVERGSDGLAQRVTGTCKDISRQREAEEHLRLLAAAFANNRDANAVLASDKRVLQANAAFLELIGISAAQLPALQLDQLLLDADDQCPWATLSNTEHWQGELTCLRQNGQRTPVELSSTLVRSRDQQIGHLVLSLRDISERRRAADHLQHLARLDVLTQLPNRLQFQEHLQRALQYQPRDLYLALLFVDLDDFKQVNDAFGHDIGDALLQQVAQRLQKALRQRDLVARWGGDEFVVLLELRSQEQVLLVADKLIKALNEPMDLAGHILTATPSIGIALAPEHGNEAGDLLRHADAAMYVAKREGRNRYALYRPELNEQLVHRIKLANLLRRALAQQELSLALQPKIRLSDQRIVGAEALLRWDTREFGRVPPDTFIPLAEELGLIVPIGHWLVREAALLLNGWQAQGWPLTLAINLSARQLRDEQLLSVLCESMADCSAPPEALELEVTESILLEDAAFARQRLQALRDAGFRIALDDFGTGYSSLSYLKELPLDRVKIDRSFISDLEQSPRGRALLSSIAGLCRALSLQTTAEGVETAAQLQLVQAEGIDEVQGYYYYPPLTIDAFNRLLQTSHREA